MKKTLFVVLGVLVASVMPDTALRAQTMQVWVSASTLDRAALTSATIYQVDAETAYFVDSSEIHPLCLPNAVDITTMPLVTMDISADGSSAFKEVDSSQFACSAIVLTDTNNRHYFLGNTTRSHPDSGYFYGTTLFATTYDRSFEGIIIASIHTLGDNEVAVMDNETNCYSNLYSAVELTTGDNLFLLKDVTLDRPLLISRNITIQQANWRISSTCSSADSALIVIDSAIVAWVGNNDPADEVTGIDSNLFDVNGGTFGLFNFNAVVKNTAVVARGDANVFLMGCELGSTNDAPVIFLLDSANASVSNTDVTSSIFVQMDSAATGTLTIHENTVLATPAVILADAYFKFGHFRKYSRSLSLAAANAIDTVHLARDIFDVADSISSPVVIEFDQFGHLGYLSIDNTTGVVVMQNGKAKYIACNGSLEINNLDYVDSIYGAPQNLAIYNSNVLSVHPDSGANIMIYSGKFGEDYSGFLAPRRVMVPNTDANAYLYPYQVVPGYRVVFANWNARGNNDTLIVCTDDNRIDSVPEPPVFVNGDTIFCAYWTDTTHRTPWNFQNSVLTSDTILYAQWEQYTAGVDARYTVLHRHQAIDGSFPDELCDTVFGVSTLGDSLIIPANSYVGFTARKMADTTASLVDGYTPVFEYLRDSVEVTFDLVGGTVVGAFNNVQRYVYGEAIVYPDTNSVKRPGWKCSGWAPALTTAPAFDVTIYATYSRRDYILTWTGLDTTVEYNPTHRGPVVTAVYTDDDNNFRNAVMTIMDNQNNVVSEAVNVGTYIIVATSADTNYRLVGTLQTTLTISPVLVSVNGIEVEKVKVYDGNAKVHVVNSGWLPINYDGINLYPITIAKYYSSVNGDTSYAIGEDKVIKAYIALGGTAAANYRLSPSEVVLATDGQIIEPMFFAPVGGEGDDDDQGLLPQADGHCNGELSAITYYLTSGSADEYRLEFSEAARAQGFTDVNWTALTSDSTVDVVVPVGAASGDYKAWLTLRRKVGGQNFDSPRLGVTFHVNVPKAYIKPIFADVISIIDTCHCIDHTSVRWYHNGLYVGDGPYYQQPGGNLTGSYYATFTIDGVPNRTCTQDDVATIVTDDSAPLAVSVYPNPTADRVTVHVENAAEFSHSLRVMNVLGMTLLDSTFEGDETDIDFSRFTQGSYTVSVDGIVVRVIKK